MRARMAAALAAKGNDTLVAGVAAYSTLGHFADPVLNTMMRYGDLELVSMLFHELAHQLIYVKDDTVVQRVIRRDRGRGGAAPLAQRHGAEGPNCRISSRGALPFRPSPARLPAGAPNSTGCITSRLVPKSCARASTKSS